jgi:hypothetical protein
MAARKRSGKKKKKKPISLQGLARRVAFLEMKTGHKRPRKLTKAEKSEASIMRAMGVF